MEPPISKIFIKNNSKAFNVLEIFSIVIQNKQFGYIQITHHGHLYVYSFRALFVIIFKFETAFIA